MIGVYLLLATSDGQMAGVQRYPTMEQCDAAAQSYSQDPKYITVQCLNNPIITAAHGNVTPSDVLGIIGNVLRQIERQR